ncbi:MAG: carboxypeptidase regulatory-like domain-containing protein [Fluviicola sp.]
MKKIMILACLIFGMGSTYAQNALGEVIGEVVDPDGAAVYDAHVFIDDVFGQRYQAKTDFDGRFRISGIPVGEYLLNIRQLKDTMQGIPVDVPRDGFYNCGAITFEGGIYKLPEIFVNADRLKMVDGNLPVTTMKAAEIQESALKFDVAGLVESMSSEIQKNANGDLIIRGSRPGDMLYLIDGVKTAEIGAMPSAAIGSLTVYTGGIPAKYGDTLGGVIAMETQSYFDLYREWKSKQLKAGK